MAKRKYSSEEIIHKLREADVLFGQGKSIADPPSSRLSRSGNNRAA